ncbi:hypothetical protein LTR97_007228 [Elasticomyces elasticus]|uniref:Uncharacterized protein n=1 Tax=Elasticomyces elasticus TaxID=574655 RepID=A0AAN7ZN41_9PEZI|nr:hypothetical protein LTR97_007228 [Elasticomyces elasticus]
MDQANLARTRSRGISFRSDKSVGSKGKADHNAESPEEKGRRDSIFKNSNKANPNAALNELTPGVSEEGPRAVIADLPIQKVLNLTEQSTLTSLRDSQHKDVNGNPIVDPDLSNPTRPRLERPLDTIRSFEKAIDNGYKRRSSYMASQSFDQNGQTLPSRRSSYMGQDGGPSPGRHSAAGGGYYGERNSHHLGQQRQRYGNRVASEGAIPNQPRPYGQHSYQQSGDTVNTGVTNGSDSTGPWANSTDPSSENSSIDKNLAAQNGYGPHGYGSPTIQEDQVVGSYGGPVQAPPAARRPIPLGDSGDHPVLPTGKLPSNARAEPEKKSGGWLKRRFSKKA